MPAQRLQLVLRRGPTHPFVMAIALSLVGFGEAAQTFAASAGWAADGFDTAGRDADFVRLGVAQARDSRGAVARAVAVLSLVTAGSALAAARDAAPHVAAGALWLDLNSVAPATKRAAAAAIEHGGGRYVDGAIMAPVRPAGRAVPILLAGPHAAAGRDVLAAAGFTNARVVAGPVGSAAAIKMIRSVMIKGREALTAECLIAAAGAGVIDEVLASLGAAAAGQADYDLERMMVHGIRRADELAEVAATLADLGVDPAMSRAAAGWQRALARGAAPAGLTAKLAQISGTVEVRAA